MMIHNSELYYTNCTRRSFYNIYYYILELFNIVTVDLKIRIHLFEVRFSKKLLETC